MSEIEPVLRELVAQQAETAQALRALTHEVRTGFERGSDRLTDHQGRISSLEHSRTRQSTLARAAIGLASSAGLLLVYERVISWFNGG